MQYLQGSSFALELTMFSMYTCLAIYSPIKDEVILTIPEVISFSPFGSDQATGEVRLLLCYTLLEVFILDTLKLTKTVIFRCVEFIRSVCTNMMTEGFVLIGVWSNNKVRYIKYKPPFAN